MIVENGIFKLLVFVATEGMAPECVSLTDLLS